MPVKSIPPRVGIIDGPVDLEDAHVVATRDFSGAGEGQFDTITLQHGNGVAQRITEACPDARLYVARIFADSLVCRPEQVAAAMRWLMDLDIHLVNMSFGLRHDREILRECCEEALKQGICLVAAAPAQGQGVYPAHYPGVVRATGDARCAQGETSWLASRQADYGAYPGRPGDAFVGASAGCASVSAALAALTAKHPDCNREQLLELLSSNADYRGVERRSSAGHSSIKMEPPH